MKMLLFLDHLLIQKNVFSQETGQNNKFSNLNILCFAKGQLTKSQLTPSDSISLT
jgi:hypothetical protein